MSERCWRKFFYLVSLPGFARDPLDCRLELGQAQEVDVVVLLPVAFCFGEIEVVMDVVGRVGSS